MGKLEEQRRRRAAADQTDGAESDEWQCEAKLTALRMAIDEGDASGVAEGSVFARVRETLALSRTPS